MILTVLGGELERTPRQDTPVNTHPLLVSNTVKVQATIIVPLQTQPGKTGNAGIESPVHNEVQQLDRPTKGYTSTPTLSPRSS